MTLAQRLLQNDKEKDDLMVLKSIKYLYEKGMLEEPKAASASYVDPSADKNIQRYIGDEDRTGMATFDPESQNEARDAFMDSEV